MQVPQEDSLASTDTEAAKVAASAMARSRRKGREEVFYPRVQTKRIKLRSDTSSQAGAAPVSPSSSEAPCRS